MFSLRWQRRRILRHQRIVLINHRKKEVSYSHQLRTKVYLLDFNKPLFSELNKVVEEVKNLDLSEKEIEPEEKIRVLVSAVNYTTTKILQLEKQGIWFC